MGADGYVSKSRQAGQYRHPVAFLHPDLSHRPDHPPREGVFRIQHGDGISLVSLSAHFCYFIPFV